MSPEARCARIAALALALACPASGAPGAEDAARDGWIEIERHGAGDDAWSVLAEQADLATLVRALARRSGHALEGLELVPRDTDVSVRLAARPFTEVLELVLGTGDLRAEHAGGVIRLRAMAGEAESLLERADEAWAALEHSRHATEAHGARGALAEARGDLAGALAHYRHDLEAELARATPSAAALERLYRSASVEARLGEWAAAAEHFHRLASEAGPLQERARLGWAAVQLARGDARGAAGVLESPAGPVEPLTAVERRILLARARMAAAEPELALQALDAGPAAPLRAIEARSFATRAEALATLGHPGAAARAWLVFAHEGANATERVTALTRAAELALENGDALAALFTCRMAEPHGLAAEFAPLARRARAALGLDSATGALSLDDGLALAESVAEAEPERAGELLARLELEHPTGGEREQTRFLATRARLIAWRDGPDRALDLLAAGRSQLASPEARAVLDRAAADLLEAAGRFAEAADAYRGVYGPPPATESAQGPSSPCR